MPWIRKFNLKMVSWFTPKGIALFRLIFGYYYEFNISPITRLLLKLYSIVCGAWMWFHIFVLTDKEIISYIYDGSILLETSVNIFISLALKQEFSMTSDGLIITYFAMFCMVIGSISSSWASFYLFDISLLDNIMFYFEYSSNICSRLPSILHAENFEKIMKSQYKALKNKFEDSNTTVDEKRQLVEQFIKGYINMSKQLEHKLGIFMFKVPLVL
ncbi:hypothetical protein B5X24_HaOG207793 [Helicoverpa armigera]|nr:hypothetical protein B5X24_HaOG207793 [Helicoverpa armigera]